MEAYVSFEKLIDEAKKQGVDFGKGDPYNRLRYYTKMGWLPHMIRKKGEENDITGHYPRSALKRLVLIENMKSKNVSNEEIARKIQSLSKWDAFFSLINSKNLKIKIVVYAMLALILFIIATETGIIHLGKTKDFMRNQILSNVKP
jgi:hypothetical protein